MKNLITILTVLSIALIPAIGKSQTPTNITKQKTPQKSEFVSFSYGMGNYDIDEVNKTRKNSGAKELKRNKNLDSFALERCKRMAKFIAQNPDKYTTDIELFDSLGHSDMYKWGSENVTQVIDGAGVLKEKIKDLKEEDVYNRLVKGTSSRPGVFLAASDYNKSEGHLKNRTRQDHKEYGSCYLAIFVYAKNFNEDGMMPYIPTLIIIHYEMFK